jgi:oxalate decarboxylase/phosphoglucose isomerase-like protein (cupin superfamily)
MLTQHMLIRVNGGSTTASIATGYTNVTPKATADQHMCVPAGLHAGGMRQLHWHLNFDEWQFVINVSTAQLQNRPA